MDWYFMAELGFVRDLGAPTDSLLAEYSKLFIAQFNTPGYDPRYVAAYRHLYCDNSNTWFPTWAALLAFNLTDNAANMAGAIASFEGTGDSAFAIQAATAGALLTKYPGGDTAWAWLKPRVHDAMSSQLATYDRRRWKILPHTAASLPPAPTTFDRWRATQTWSAASQLDTADPDGDGRNNLLEYALGSSPTAPNPELTPQIIGTDLVLTYTLDPRKTDLTYITETSTDLLTWTPVASTLVSATADFAQTRIATTPTGSTRKFLRLRVTR